MDDWYGIGAYITGAIVFFGTWIVCSLTYGFLGFALGWMPAIILAGIVGMLWPLAVLLLLVVAAFVWKALT